MPNSRPRRKYRTEYVSSKGRITAGQIASAVLILAAMAALFGLIVSMG